MRNFTNAVLVVAKYVNRGPVAEEDSRPFSIRAHNMVMTACT